MTKTNPPRFYVEGPDHDLEDLVPEERTYAIFERDADGDDALIALLPFREVEGRPDTVGEAAEAIAGLLNRYGLLP